MSRFSFDNQEQQTLLQKNIELDFRDIFNIIEPNHTDV